MRIVWDDASNAGDAVQNRAPPPPLVGGVAKNRQNRPTNKGSAAGRDLEFRSCCAELRNPLSQPAARLKARRMLLQGAVAGRCCKPRLTAACCRELLRRLRHVQDAVAGRSCRALLQALLRCSHRVRRALSIISRWRSHLRGGAFRKSTKTRRQATKWAMLQGDWITGLARRATFRFKAVSSRRRSAEQQPLLHAAAPCGCTLRSGVSACSSALQPH